MQHFFTFFYVLCCGIKFYDTQFASYLLEKNILFFKLPAAFTVENLLKHTHFFKYFTEDVYKIIYLKILFLRVRLYKLWSPIFLQCSTSSNISTVNFTWNKLYFLLYIPELWMLLLLSKMKLYVSMFGNRQHIKCTIVVYF